MGSYYLYHIQQRPVQPIFVRQSPAIIIQSQPRMPITLDIPPQNIILRNEEPQPIIVRQQNPNVIIQNERHDMHDMQMNHMPPMAFRGGLPISPSFPNATPLNERDVPSPEDAHALHQQQMHIQQFLPQHMQMQNQQHAQIQRGIAEADIPFHHGQHGFETMPIPMNHMYAPNNMPNEPERNHNIHNLTTNAIATNGNGLTAEHDMYSSYMQNMSNMNATPTRSNLNAPCFTNTMTYQNNASPYFPTNMGYNHNGNFAYGNDNPNAQPGQRL